MINYTHSIIRQKKIQRYVVMKFTGTCLFRLDNKTIFKCHQLSEKNLVAIIFITHFKLLRYISSAIIRYRENWLINTQR